MRDLRCEDCESQVRELTRSRSLTVFERELLWRAIHQECRVIGCPAICPTRGLVSRVSANLAVFVERYSQVKEGSARPDSGTLPQEASLVH
jgi:hypothetical protein